MKKKNENKQLSLFDEADQKAIDKMLEGVKKREEDEKKDKSKDN